MAARFRRWTPSADGEAATPIVANPADNCTYECSFGFQREIVSGLYLVSCSVSASVLNSGAGSVTVGAIAIVGPVVQVVLSGGVAGNSYLVTFTALLSNGQTRVLNGQLNVVVQ